MSDYEFIGSLKSLSDSHQHLGLSPWFLSFSFLASLIPSLLGLSMTLNYLENHNLTSIRIIAGSIRNVDQIEKAFSSGADIVTITPPLLQQWIFTKRGVETVQEFNQAYRDVKEKFTLF